MKRFFYSLNYKRIVAVLVIVLFVVILTGCSRNNDAPINGWLDEKWYDKFSLWPIAWVMHKIGTFFGGSYGWAVIFTTILVRFAAWPIYSGMNNMSFGMSLAQDDIARVQAKYAGKTDPQSRQRMSAEMQAVYKKHNIKFSSCLALPIQMFIFMGMYGAISRIKNPGGKYTLTDQVFLSFDLSVGVFGGGVDIKDRLFAIFLVILVVGTQLASIKIGQKKPSYAKNIPNRNPQAEAMQKNMKIMLYVMPIMMGFFAATSAGLALYWVVGNTCQLIQTIVNRKIQENKYKKLHPDKYLSNKDIKQTKPKKQNNDVIDV